MIKSIYYILALSILTACNSNTILKKPDNLLPKEKMVTVLTESYIAKNAKSIRNLDNKRNVNYLSNIYKEQGIDSVTFNESLRYYTADISLHEEILKLVKQSIDKNLEALKAVRDTIYNTRIDSLKKAQKILLDQEITDLKAAQQEKLNIKIDSIKESQNNFFDKKITALEKKLKDTLKIKTPVQVYKDSIYKQIESVEKEKTEAINLEVKKVESQHQKLVDKKIDNVKDKDKNYINKKTKEFERQKYK